MQRELWCVVDQNNCIKSIEWIILVENVLFSNTVGTIVINMKIWSEKDQVARFAKNVCDSKGIIF